MSIRNAGMKYRLARDYPREKKKKVEEGEGLFGAEATIGCLMVDAAFLVIRKRRELKLALRLTFTA